MTIMVRIKQDPPKILTSKEKDILEALYVKEDMLLEWLLEHSSDHPDYHTMTSRLHENGIKILRLEGGKALEVNEDFRK